uniref:Uncharacterized protein n=1 Tax=uncultured Thiotrichaceae bacterium TaxID=298394 RepID=A0A6S6S4A1_9GAMM|nr:MAG: Unknown protein [uncultured Thiotrichaceae bacterium]
MTNTHSKLLMKLIMLLTLTLGIVYANNIMSPKQQVEKQSYADMSTSQLQIEVERLSAEDKLPFEMGLEIIKRWQTDEANVH